MKPLSANEPKKHRARDSDTAVRTAAALTRLVDSITPWLLDLGNWIYGGLIAFSLVLLGVLLTIGPVDMAVKIATTAFALALPLDVTGFVLLRLFADMEKVSLRELGAKAMVEAGFTVEGGDSTSAGEGKLRRVALRYSYGVLTWTVLLTLVGVTAALWHMAWWIGLVFVATVLASQGVALVAVSALGPAGRWRTPAGEVEPPKST